MSDFIYRFMTERFTVLMTAEPDGDLDLSWDDTGEVAEGLYNGRFEAFRVKCAVLLDGNEIAADYLGGCIYESPSQFVDGDRNGYFRDMVRSSVAFAREAISRMEDLPKLRTTYA